MKTAEWLDAFLPAHLAGMSPYVPGEQPRGEGWVKLNTNENPYPPSPRVEEAIRQALPLLRKYPQPASISAREALAAHHRLSPDQVLVGNGSDDVLNLLVRVFAGEQRPVAALDPSYSLYPILAGIQGAPFEAVPFGPDFEIPQEALQKSRARLFFLTSPNAPTGLGFSRDTVSAVAQAFPGILVVDEAYADFALESAVPLIRRYPRMVVTRSFSKSHGLAGLRIGYALAPPEVIAQLDKVRDSYNVDLLAQAGLRAALSDPGYYAAILKKIRNTRNFYQRWLENLGWDTFPSQTNFLTTRPQTPAGETGPEVAAACFEFLKDRKILVRHFPRSPRVAAYLRISVGTEEEMATLEENILAWVESAKS